MRRVALHRVHEVGDEVVAALEHGFHLGPGTVDALVQADDPVVDRDAPQEEPQHNDYDGDQGFCHDG